MDAAAPDASPGSEDKWSRDMWECARVWIEDKSQPKHSPERTIEARLMSRMGKRDEPKAQRELVVLAVTKEGQYYATSRTPEAELMPPAWTGAKPYWEALREILSKDYPCHTSQTREWSHAGDDEEQAAKRQRTLESAPPKHLIASLDRRDAPVLNLVFSHKGAHTLRKAGQISLKHQKAGVLHFGRIVADALTRLQDQVDEQWEGRRGYEQENKQLKAQLATALQAKADLEKGLYAKFLCVLNEKKRKIQELEDEAASGRGTTAGGSPLRDAEPYGGGDDDDMASDDEVPGDGGGGGAARGGGTLQRAETLAFGDDSGGGGSTLSTASTGGGTRAVMPAATTAGSATTCPATLRGCAAVLLTRDGCAGSMAPPPPRAGQTQSQPLSQPRGADPAADLLDEM